MVDVEAMYRQFAPLVLRRCTRLLRDEAQGVDAMQDVFVQLIRHEHQLTNEAPASLLLQIATRVCLNRLRSHARHPEDRDDELLCSIASAQEPEEKSMASQLLSKVFGTQPASTRTMAVMHLVDGLTLEETAREVGLSVSGVRKRLRALQASLAQMEAA